MWQSITREASIYETILIMQTEVPSFPYYWAGISLGTIAPLNERSSHMQSRKAKYA